MGVVLVFDVEGDMALFRKPYTTTSMVSYPFPPPTAIAGLIGAIVGINHGAAEDAKNAYFWEHLQDLQIGLSLQHPIRWIKTAVNLMKFKTANADMTEHIQVKHQLLKKPRYRIYVRGGSIYPDLKQRLEREEFIYTPCLGPAYALAEMSYQGEYAAEAANEQQGFDTVVPAYEGLELDVVRSGAVFSERVPAQMSTRRRLLNTVLVYYTQPESQKTKPLYLRQSGVLESSLVNGEKVAWFNAW
ncbi:MAG TPA: type I-B CRISPR-associated protein Cas5 [Gelria sp.]|jgi:CRISPR-associated protein Cas5h|nr:type I-B CRISPR-associated protein Cas5 [Gelria sp.]